jgi:hypothetical protein
MAGAEYRVIAVPDLIMADGTVQHGTDSVNALRNRRRHTWEKAVALYTAAGTESRMLTEDEASRWDLLMENLIELDIRIAATGSPL